MARTTGSPLLTVATLSAVLVLVISLGFLLGERLGREHQPKSNDELNDMRRSIDELSAKIQELQTILANDHATSGRRDPRTDWHDEVSTAQDHKDSSGPSIESVTVLELVQEIENLAQEVERLREAMLDSAPVPLGPVVRGGVQIGENMEAIRQRLGDPGIQQDQNGNLFLEYRALGVLFYFNPNMQLIRVEEIIQRE